jgi:DNA-binding beta-propeller fold protein YncE
MKRCAGVSYWARNLKTSLQARAAGPLLVCALVMVLGVGIGHGQPVPDTIMLPDSLGPLRPDYHLAFGSSTNNIYVASESSDIIVVDGNTFQRIKRINTGTPVGGSLLVSQHNRLYCSYPQQGHIGVIDCATNTVVGSIQVGTRPTSLIYSSGNDKLYCGDTVDRTVTVIDCAADTVRKVISIGKGLAAMAYDPTTGKMYAATQDALLAISCSADSIVSTISSVKSARGLSINKRLHKLYAVGQQYSYPDTVFVVSTVTDQTTARVPIGGELWPPLACNELTDRLYGVFGGSVAFVFEFDCAGDTLIRYEPEASNARTLGLFCDSVRNRLYYLRQTDNAGFVLALDCATLDAISDMPVGSYPEVLQADPARYRLMHAGGSSEAAALTVLDYKGDSLYDRGATPLSGWTQDMCHNSASGKLYYWWGYGASGVGVVDELTNRLESQVFLSLTESWQQAYSRTSNKLYFLALRRGLGVMDGSRDSLIKVIEMGYAGTGIRPSWCPDANKVYCSANEGARRYIAAVDCHTDSVVREIDIYDYFESFEYLGEGRVLCRQWKHLTLIDSRADTVLVDSAVEASEYRAIAHTGDGDKVYIAFNNRLEVRSSSTLSLLATIDWAYSGPTFGGGSLVCSDTTHKLYWFSDYGDSTLAIDTHSDTVVARMPIGGCRTLSCLDRTGRYLFCFSSHVRVYDTRTDSLVAVNPLSLRPLSVTPNPEQGCIYVGCQDVILVYSDVPPGVEEGQPQATSHKPQASIVRGVLFLPPTFFGPSAVSLLSADGRKVLDLHAGANDVRGLTPGVYFSRRPKAEDGRSDGTVLKVVIAK